MNFELKNMILTYTKHFLMKKKALINKIMKSFFSKLPNFYHKFLGCILDPHLSMPLPWLPAQG
jgi:hypothetical protein